MIHSRRPRGISALSVLLLLLLLGAVWWGISYGGAYLDNVSIRSDLREAANLAVRDPSNDNIRKFILTKLAKYPNLDVTPDDVQIERTNEGKFITIDLNYQRRVKPLFADSEKAMSFTRRVEEDISPVRW